MNNYTESLLEQLKSGKSVDELAKELTEALNTAKSTYEAKNEKAADGEELADMLNYYIATYYGNFGETSNLFTKDDVEVICDTVQEVFEYLRALLPNFKAKTKSQELDDKAIIKNFLRELK